MRKVAEGGALGTAQKAYTRQLIAFANLGFLAFLIYDLWGGGSGILCAALHFKSKVWTALFFVLAGWIPSGFAASAVSIAYTRYTGVTYIEDRLGYARSGGSDISYWTGLLSMSGALVVSYQWEVPGLSSVVRSLVIVFAATVVAMIGASIISRLLFRLMYGPPVPGPLWKD
jgi:hypothetical protein